MRYTAQYWIAVGVAVALGLLGAIQLADPGRLGLTPQVTAWCGILSSGLGVLAGFLPRVTATPSDDRKGLD